MALFADSKRPFPQINPIWNAIQEALNIRRFQSYGAPSPPQMPWVRFTSPKGDRGYENFHIGLHTSAAPPDAPVFELSYGGADIVGYAYRNGSRQPIKSTDSSNTPGLTSAEGRHPIPGVTSARVDYLGPTEPIKVTVHWNCYNTTQLEFLRHHFGLTGSYVVLEIGQASSISNSIGNKFDWGTSSGGTTAAAALAGFTREGRKLIIENYVIPNGGNYDIFVGQTTNYGVTIRPDGSFECFTEFYSVGEAIYGINNYSLLKFQHDSDLPGVSYTIDDYFKTGKEFEKLIRNAEKEKEHPQVLNLKASKSQFRSNQRAISKLANDLKENPLDIDRIEDQLAEQYSDADGTFISWNYFLREIIPDIFKTVNLGTGASDINNQIKLLEQINLGSAGQDRDSTDGEPLVGDHKLLATTDLFTMVIVKSEYLEKDSAKIFNHPTNPLDLDSVIFSGGRRGPESGLDFATTSVGVLSKGIWINKDAIVESFTNANNFYSAINTLLTRMSNATAGYWKLFLVFDDDAGIYKIYDKNLIAENINDIKEDTYIFNRGSFGELLSLEFNAEYSNEMKTAMLLSSRVQPVKTGNTMANQLKGLSIVPGPRVHGPVIEQTSLEDLVQKALNKYALDIAKFARAAGPDPAAAAKANAASAVRPAEEKDAGTQLEIAKSIEVATFNQSLSHYWKYASELLSTIRDDGLDWPQTPNAFIAPVPTDINLTLKIRGLSGLQYFDYFYVDKLPPVYGKHGVFIVNSLIHEISTESGWVTTIGGLYYFCFLDGNNDKQPPPPSDEDDITFHAPALPAPDTSTSNRRNEKFGGAL